MKAGWVAGGVLAVAAVIATAAMEFSRAKPGELPANGPSLKDSNPALSLAGPGHLEKRLDDASDVSANPRGEMLARHDDPVGLVQSYHQAVDAGNMDAVTECYMPERRQAVAGMLGVVPRKMEWQKLSYELADRQGDLAFVRVKGKDVKVDGRPLTIDEKVKVRRVRGHWYLDDL